MNIRTIRNTIIAVVIALALTVIFGDFLLGLIMTTAAYLLYGMGKRHGTADAMA